MSRESDGVETWRKLRDWSKGQASSERLAAHILNHENYEGIDPSHPLGGKDGGKDLICSKYGLKFLVAVYFPRGEKTFTNIKNKYKDDLDGIEKNNVDGMVFCTNQELKLSERTKLEQMHEKEIHLFHLERISSILNRPSMYGVRLDHLDIEMTKEEQVAFHSTMQEMQADLLNQIVSASSTGKPIENITVQANYEGLLGGKKRVKCSQCGFGFYAETGSLALSGFQKNPSAPCPNCGSVEPVRLV